MCKFIIDTCSLSSPYLFQFLFSCQAKFLWKRIPDHVKKESPALQSIWSVGQALFRRDPPAVHAALAKEDWPPQYQDYINNLKGKMCYTFT